MTRFQLLDLPQQLFSWRRVHGQQSPKTNNTHLTISREMTNRDLKMRHHNHRFTNLIHSPPPLPPSFLPLSSCLCYSLYSQFLELKNERLKGQEALYFRSLPLSIFFLFLGFWILLSLTLSPLSSFGQFGNGVFSLFLSHHHLNLTIYTLRPQFPHPHAPPTRVQHPTQSNPTAQVSNQPRLARGKQCKPYPVATSPGFTFPFSVKKAPHYKGTIPILPPHFLLFPAPLFIRTKFFWSEWEGKKRPKRHRFVVVAS